MILYLVRHAIALPAAGGRRDESRALSSEGIQKFKAAARGFAAMDPRVSHLYASPLVRAVQTAELLHDALTAGKKGRGEGLAIAIEPALGPPGDLRRSLAGLRRLPKSANVAAVGHEPALSQWVGELCFGQAGGVEMKKGAIAAIELTGVRRGKLLWLLQPRQLRKLGK